MNLYDKLKKTCEKYNGLSITMTDEGYVLNGVIVLCAEYEGVPLYDEYYLEIIIPHGFPAMLPSVKDIGGTIPKSINHFYDSGALCLGASCEMLDFLAENPSVTEFIDTFVMSYLYTASFFDRYGRFPYGERSHGIKGVEEAYMERYGCANRKLLMKLLLYLTGTIKYRGHLPCDCGSGKKFRDCHGKRVIKDLKSVFSDYYKNDACCILINYSKEKRGECYG